MIRRPLNVFDNTSSGDLDKIPQYGTVHIIDYDGLGTPKYIHVHDIENLGITINTIAELLTASGKWTNVSGLMWKNLWVDGTYVEGDLVRDGAWTMTPNQITDERPAPQNIGLLEDSIPLDSVFVTNSNNTAVRMVHSLTMTKEGYFNGIRIKVPVYTSELNNRILISNQTTGESSLVASNAILTSGSWTSVTSELMVARIGDIIDIVLILENVDSSNSITGNWGSDQGGGDPAPEKFICDDLKNPVSLKIHQTDQDSNNRLAELDAIPTGASILIQESGDSSRSVTVRVTGVSTVGVTFTQYDVVVINNGDKDIRDNKDCSILSNAGGLSPTEYYHIVDDYPTNNPSFATVTSKLFFDGVEQADVNDSYGINMIFQEANMSDHWELVAYSGAASEGDAGLTTGIEEAPNDGNAYVRKNEAWWIISGLVTTPPFTDADAVGGLPDDTIFTREIDCLIPVRDDVDLDFDGATP